MDCLILVEKTSNKIEVTIWDDTQSPVTDATIQVTVVDQNQEAVPGIAFPQTMTNEGGGVYSVLLAGDLEIVRNQNYWVQIQSSSPTRGDLYQEALAKCMVMRI